MNIPDEIMYLIQNYILKVRECDDLKAQVSMWTTENSHLRQLVLEYKEELQREKSKNEPKEI